VIHCQFACLQGKFAQENEMERCVLSLLAVLLLVGSVSALYDSKGPVALLGSRSFGAVTRSKVPVVVVSSVRLGSGQAACLPPFIIHNIKTIIISRCIAG
jgi:hypothetical protein